ncbi:ki-ras-induced actin-interacting protein-IP3R-interacting domain olf186-M isoform X2 [Andrena cerasifolii]
MRRRTGPVQQWVDSIPSPIKSNLLITNEQQGTSADIVVTPVTPTEPKDIPYSMGTKLPTMTVSAPIKVPNVPTINTPGLPSSLPHKLVRDPSLQSDSSHCSSVESLLELRKADPEAILLGLGFGGCPGSPQENGSLSRIPKRFLQPSKLKGIAINDFMKHQQETSESIDSVSLGYRGLTGSPYVAPSEIVQKIMKRLRDNESHDQDAYSMYNSYEQYSPMQCNGTFSVLSPDSRQFLERPRSKSPDMRNKRMIIGQKSFAFGHDGDLIEINPSDAKRSSENNFNSDSAVAENSEILGNLGGTDIDRHKISDEVAIQKTEKIIPKKLLFDECIEHSDIDVNSSMKTCEEPSSMGNTSLDEKIDYNEDILLNISSQNLYDFRRASDGSCNIKPGENLSTVHERRHSDSFVHAFEDGSCGSVISQKRRTLKRQTRISDIDAISYHDLKTCGSYKAGATSEPSASIRTKSLQTMEDLPSRSENESCVAACSNTFSNEMDDRIQSVDSILLNEEQQEDCTCSIEKNQCLERVSMGEEEETATCRCCPGTTKYWEKMEKMIKKNKNLESMVVRNRREMAEIREMLNSVLSVRLEPGF